jgi:hypothetical protein
MNAARLLTTLGLLLLCISSAGADDALSGLVRIEVLPREATLIGPRGVQHFIVTGVDERGELRDVTAQADFHSTAAAIMQMQANVARPVADGQAQVRVEVGGLSQTVPVTVRDVATADPMSFKTEVLGALTKAGCNSGACHGSPSGKGGFRLSLLGYDPVLDIHTLRTEFSGRRTNLMDPDESLLLKKPLMEVGHVGGRRFEKGDPAHIVLRDWIAEGMRLDPAEEPDLLSIKVLPGDRRFGNVGERQQLIVQGTFSDGSVCDVTALTVFTSSNEQVARVDFDGVVTKEGRGEAAILARYLDKMHTVTISFLPDREGFAWSHPEQENFVDHLVNTKLESLQILPSELCTDDEFVRRAYLDAAGRLPTLEESQAFVASDSPDKRAELIDRLLESSDHAWFWALRWADVLRVNSGKLQPVGVAKFTRWIYEGVLSDQPMDQFAHELLTASGSVFENPPANYWRASREPTDATETTAQLFLGIRIQCAKCHNHPFERWTQDNYYGIGAAFARVGRKKSFKPEDEIIFVQDAGEVTQPRTGETMKVHLLLEGDKDVPPEVDRREVFADWLTAPDNPFFARAVANRVWGHLLGRGIVEPVDDFRDSNPPSNPALLEELAHQFVEHGYSRKWLIRTIMNSRTYQRSARTNEFNAGDDRYFSHAMPRMLSAEQLLDAVCHVTGVPETFDGVPPGTRATQLPEPPKNHAFLRVFGQPQREMACECERSSDSNLSQALQMINGPTVHDKLRADTGRIKALIDSGASDDSIIRELYQVALSRQPTDAELNAALTHIEGTPDRRLGLEDIGWAVLNMKEFLFQH